MYLYIIYYILYLKCIYYEKAQRIGNGKSLYDRITGMKESKVHFPIVEWKAPK